MENLPSCTLQTWTVSCCLSEQAMSTATRNSLRENTIFINIIGLEKLCPTLESIQPDILVCITVISVAMRAISISKLMLVAKAIASSWKPNESANIQATATRNFPGVRTFIVPHDILAEEGPDAVMAFCQKALTDCIRSISQGS